MWRKVHLVEAMCLLQRPSIHEIVTLVGWDTGNSCLQSRWYHFDRNNLLASSILEYEISQWPQRLIVLCAIHDKKSSGEARGVWVRRYRVWWEEMGRQVRQGHSLASLFPTFGTSVGVFFFFFAVINIFRIRHTKCKVSYLLLIWEEHSPQQEVLWGGECRIGRIWFAGRACSAPPPPFLLPGCH